MESYYFYFFFCCYQKRENNFSFRSIEFGMKRDHSGKLKEVEQDTTNRTTQGF